MLKGALIGVGHVALNGHLPGWTSRRDATLVAAADSRDGGKAAFLAAFPQARWYASAEELLGREAIDFADIATPPGSHAELIRMALERCLHVLCEKPLVLTPEELTPLAALAGQKGRALVTVHNWKHAAALAKLTALVREGAIGRVRHCRWETLRAQPAVAIGEAGNWRVDPTQSGGGVLVDHGWHAFYLVASWLGEAPRALRASLENRKHHALPIEDTATVKLDCGSASAEIFLTWAAGQRANRVVIEGEQGMLRLDGGRLEVCGRKAVSPKRTWDLPSIAEGSHHPEWFQGVADDFLEEVTDPGRRGRNLEEAALCATLIALAQESSRRGGQELPLSAFVAQVRG